MAGEFKNLKGSIGGKVTITGKASVVATVTTAERIFHIACPITTDREFLIKAVIEEGGFKMTLEEMDLYAEAIKQAGGFGKFKLGANVVAGGGEVEIDKKPNSEVKMMAHLKYVRDRTT